MKRTDQSGSARSTKVAIAVCEFLDTRERVLNAVDGADFDAGICALGSVVGLMIKARNKTHMEALKDIERFTEIMVDDIDGHFS